MRFATIFNILKPNYVWSMALYGNSEKFNFADKRRELVKVFDSRKLRTRIRHVHTRADPFLFVWNNELFLFFESMSVNEAGGIAVYKTVDLKCFKYLGVVLKENHHLSYPFVFRHGRSVFMIPESGAAGEVVLYRFGDFPSGLEKIRVLLAGKYYDTSLIFHEGMWYLFTTSEYGLEIFSADDLEHGVFSPHPDNPITVDPRVSRCGGPPVLVEGGVFRIAQDCSSKYGGNLNILRILELTPSSYREEMVHEGYFDCDETWNRDGGHHFSLTNFRGKTVIAVDGRQQDYLLNKLLSPVFNILAKIFPKNELLDSIR